MIPIVFFVLHSLEDIGHGTASDILWVCNVANLCLGMPNARLRRAAALWIIAGLPFWLREVWIAPATIYPGSYLIHLGALPFAIRALKKPATAWPLAITGFVVLQAITRLVANPALNTNVAFSMRDGWDKVFTSYWQYWLFTTLVAGVTLMVVDKVARRETA